MHFRNYGLWETWLDNCLESPVSEDPSTGNRLNGFFFFFFSFLKYGKKFENFKKKDESHSWRISEIKDSEKRG